MTRSEVRDLVRQLIDEAVYRFNVRQRVDGTYTVTVTMRRHVPSFTCYGPSDYSLLSSMTAHAI